MGYIHVDRPGKLSLVFDLMEPFRPMVDRFVISFLKKLSPAYFSEKAKSNTISMLRNQFFSDFMQNKIEYKGRKMMIETVMFYYLQEFVSFLRGRRESFTIPYIPW
jgi:CRISPR-associated protein Cas1